MLSNARKPLLGFAAYSGTGKTTLLVKLIPMLNAKGIRVGMIKHAHHSFDIDQPGKDSYELRKAGAVQTLVASRQRWALITEHADPQQPEPRLNELLRHLDQDSLDLILVEGFKHEPYPKIELHRKDLGHPYLFTEDASIIALACGSKPEGLELPTLLDINNPEEILAFIEESVLEKTKKARQD